MSSAADSGRACVDTADRHMGGTHPATNAFLFSRRVSRHSGAW